MKSRFTTALVIFAVYASCISLAIYVDKFFYDLLIMSMMIVAGIEMSKAISTRFEKPITFFIILNAIVGYAFFIVTHTYIGKGSGGITAFFGALAFIFVLCIIYNMFSHEKSIKNVVSTMFVLIYPVALLVYMLAINYVAEPFRVSSILLVFFVSSFTDIFAYLVGSTFKGPKLMPSVSPKKTISGAIGGIFGGLLGAGLVLLFGFLGWFNVLPLSENFTYNILHFLALGLGGAVLTQLGDLTASYIKRACDIKDYGTFLPGHGGIMDRVDGMMMNGIFVYIYISILMIL